MCEEASQIRSEKATLSTQQTMRLVGALHSPCTARCSTSSSSSGLALLRPALACWASGRRVPSRPGAATPTSQQQQHSSVGSSSSTRTPSSRLVAARAAAGGGGDAGGTWTWKSPDWRELQRKGRAATAAPGMCCHCFSRQSLFRVGVLVFQPLPPPSRTTL